MSSQTTYYEFNKPSGTDLVNPLVDTNPNWDIADAGMHELDTRSIANATETVVLGVHAISTLNTYTKFIRWIATANFTAGDTFTVNGDAVAATTPAGATLATNAYVTGSVVLACLNADNTAMTIFVSGTNVATDSERLGGELPSYYATDSDMDSAQTDIANIQALLGTTSIASIGDGTATGAISAIYNDLLDLEGKMMSVPDFTKPVTITNNQAVAKDLIMFAERNSHSTCSIKINNNTVATGYINAGVHSGFEYGQFSLKAGDVPSFTDVTVYGFELLA